MLLIEACSRCSPGEVSIEKFECTLTLSAVSICSPVTASSPIWLAMLLIEACSRCSPGEVSIEKFECTLILSAVSTCSPVITLSPIWLAMLLTEACSSCSPGEELAVIDVPLSSIGAKA